MNNNFDPNAKQAEQEAAGAAVDTNEQAAAQESASQNQAVGATQDSEEGT